MHSAITPSHFSHGLGFWGLAKYFFLLVMISIKSIQFASDAILVKLCFDAQNISLKSRFLYHLSIWYISCKYFYLLKNKIAESKKILTKQKQLKFIVMLNKKTMFYMIMHEFNFIILFIQTWKKIDVQITTLVN